MAEINKIEITEKALNGMENLIENAITEGFLSEDFNVERENNQIEAVYDFDGYDSERIRINLDVNDYGVITFFVNVESYSGDNELQLNDYFYCLESKISEKKLEQTEKQENKKLQGWLAKPTITLSGPHSNKIKVRNVELSRQCFSNITHYHYYLGKSITLYTKDIDLIIPFIILRDFFNSIGD